MSLENSLLLFRVKPFRFKNAQLKIVNTNQAALVENMLLYESTTLPITLK